MHRDLFDGCRVGDWHSGFSGGTAKFIIHFPLQNLPTSQSLHGSILFWTEKRSAEVYRWGRSRAKHESLMIQIEGEDLIRHLEVDSLVNFQPKDLFFLHPIRAPPMTANRKVLLLDLVQEGVPDPETTINYSVHSKLWRKLAELLGWTPSFGQVEGAKTGSELVREFVLDLVAYVITPP